MHKGQISNNDVCEALYTEDSDVAVEHLFRFVRDYVSSSYCNLWYSFQSYSMLALVLVDFTLFRVLSLCRFDGIR